MKFGKLKIFSIILFLVAVFLTFPKEASYSKEQWTNLIVLIVGFASTAALVTHFLTRNKYMGQYAEFRYFKDGTIFEVHAVRKKPREPIGELVLSEIDLKKTTSLSNPKRKGESRTFSTGESEFDIRGSSEKVIHDLKQFAEHIPAEPLFIKLRVRYEQGHPGVVNATWFDQANIQMTREVVIREFKAA